MEIDLEKENQEIARAYRGLLRSCKFSKTAADRRDIRKAFDIALEAHKEMRRKSGEPYIYHPIAVSRIVAEEMGLGTTSIVCALLHDTVEDTYITLDDIQNLFGSKERLIIDGLTKISGVFDHNTSAQAENFRKMLLTLSDDIRVILIKLADRLHNMRTLDSMPRHKQLKIASETLFMYAPLAHRLGLYKIKTELEDLSLKFKEPETYTEIVSKLQKTQAVRTRFINQFVLPIRQKLQEEGFDFTIKGRTKSIYSIWNKMVTKHVTFEDIYDVFAVRIIIDTEVNQEKGDAWKVYSVVTDYYQPNPDRLRDWISLPKANGYESLHTTVMSPGGRWVEVQIRSRRMDEVAEKGYAAHWKYKTDNDKEEDEQNPENNLDTWLGQIREMLESGSEDALEFLDNFRLNFYAEEIYIFTPNGDLKTLPKGATPLDFAFSIHSQVGATTHSAKVSGKLVPLSHVLKSGDQVEILTRKNQRPKEDWLNYVVTARARQKIKASLKEERKRIAGDGKDMLRRKFSHIGVNYLSINITELERHYKMPSATDLYFNIATGRIDLKKMKAYSVDNGRIFFEKVKGPEPTPAPVVKRVPGSKDTLLIGDAHQKIDYTLAVCCSPIPGDDVFGYVTTNEGLKIHRSNCPNATDMLSHHVQRVIKAVWASKALTEFEVTLAFSGVDDMGLVRNVTNVISDDNKVNMRAISFESLHGVFEGSVRVLVQNTQHLDDLITQLKNVDGVHTVSRRDTA